LGSVCEHVHLPLQSADDAVLRSMKRSYTYKQFCQIVEKLRKAVPGISITTDLIVGFPGETDAQFRRTLAAVEDLQFDQAFMFIYSPRRLTEAYDFSDNISPDIQKARLTDLIARSNDIFHAKNAALVGQTFEVLVEGTSEKNAKKLSGRTRQNKVMVFEGNKDLIGQLANVKVEKGFLWGFEGRKLESMPSRKRGLERKKA
jgi:tRNA-2-methylthio-N6-dimethylallyladenosine synthase